MFILIVTINTSTELKLQYTQFTLKGRKVLKFFIVNTMHVLQILKIICNNIVGLSNKLQKIKQFMFCF